MCSIFGLASQIGNKQTLNSSLTTNILVLLPIHSRDYLQSKSFWYGSPDDDRYVREKLGDLYEKAKSGELDNWSDTAEGGLALIILLDQVPRNIFRDTPQAYATDDRALVVARKMIQAKWDKNMPNIQRRYVYSPFNHSEKLPDQETSVRLFTELGEADHLYWAKSFYNTIKQHGRFPHRDHILGRN